MEVWTSKHRRTVMNKRSSLEPIVTKWDLIRIGLKLFMIWLDLDFVQRINGLVWIHMMLFK